MDTNGRINVVNDDIIVVDQCDLPLETAKNLVHSFYRSLLLIVGDVRQDFF